MSRTCNNDLLSINNILSEHSVNVNKEYHFYEGLKKYNIFFAGWDDNDEAVVIDMDNYDKYVTSPHKELYTSLWLDYIN